MKLTTKVAVSTLACATLLLNGCASIVSTHIRPITFTSNPTGVPFYIKDSSGREIHSGMTPDTVTLETGAGYFTRARYSVTFTSQGQQQVRPLEATLNGWYWGNIVFGSFLGFLVVDPATGSMWTLPATVTADPFMPATTPATPAAVSAAAPVPASTSAATPAATPAASTN